MSDVSVVTFAFPGRFAECRAIRVAVFIEEQAVREDEELDGLDPQCVHFLAEVSGCPAGTARLRVCDASCGKAERVAVLRSYRGHGVGRALMHALEQEARGWGLTQVLLGAQVSAVPFYERLGYVAEGEPFLDARIVHRWMRRQLADDQTGVTPDHQPPAGREPRAAGCR